MYNEKKNKCSWLLLINWVSECQEEMNVCLNSSEIYITFKSVLNKIILQGHHFSSLCYYYSKLVMIIISWQCLVVVVINFVVNQAITDRLHVCSTMWAEEVVALFGITVQTSPYSATQRISSGSCTWGFGGAHGR